MIFIQPLSTISLFDCLLGEVFLRERLGHLRDNRMARRYLVEFSGYVKFGPAGYSSVPKAYR